MRLSKHVVASEFALLFLAVFLTGCPQGTTIAKINQDPSRYQGKEVTIAGHVVTSFGAMSQGVFLVDDGTGQLWVLSNGFGVPGRDARVRVTGTVVSGVTFFGRSFTNALRETHRRKDLGSY
jgi:hypothetical protein